MSSLQIDQYFVRLRLVCNSVGTIVSPRYFDLFCVCPDLPRASARFVTTDCIVAMGYYGEERQEKQLYY